MEIQKTWKAIDRKLPKNNYLRFLIFSLFLSVIGPLIFKLPFLDGVIRMVVLLFVINGIFAFLIGYYSRKHGLKWYALLIFPIIFLIVGVLIRLIPILYSVSFIFFYLVISMYSYNTDYRSDPDENQIPVEGGFGKNK